MVEDQLVQDQLNGYLKRTNVVRIIAASSWLISSAFIFVIKNRSSSRLPRSINPSIEFLNYLNVLNKLVISTGEI